MPELRPLDAVEQAAWPVAVLVVPDETTMSAQRHALADGTVTAWAFVLFALAACGLFGLVLWRVLEATLLRL